MQKIGTVKNIYLKNLHLLSHYNCLTKLKFKLNVKLYYVLVYEISTVNVKVPNYAITLCM